VIGDSIYLRKHVEITMVSRKSEKKTLEKQDSNEVQLLLKGKTGASANLTYIFNT
jgi:hypothetical protein